jgi:Fur family transcriptional regulator, ferric uptake regulator
MVSDALSALEGRGYRLTGPRKQVLLLLSRQERGITAEAVCDRLPAVGRATVYRTIKLLVEEGVACKVNMPDGTALYALDDARQHHHHVVCVHCGLTKEFSHPAAERMVRALKDVVEGAVVGHRIDLYIVCPQCSASLITGERTPKRMAPHAH